MLYRITLPYACYGIEVSDNNIVTEAPPIAKWMAGEWLETVQIWVRRKGGKIERVAQNEK